MRPQGISCEKESKMERKMNLFAKTGTWLVASVMMASTMFAQNGQNGRCAPPAEKCCPQPVCCPPKKCCEEVKKVQLTCAYNAPARIEVRGCWDIYASGSFTYWQAVQDNMELGSVNSTLVPFDVTVQNMDFSFEPGFKVALGMNFDHDNWDTRIEYTWFRGNTSTSVSLDPAGTFFLYPSWTNPASVVTDIYFAGSERWKLHMDLLDWELARAYFVGKKLTFRPFIALRGAWIRQNLDVDYTLPAGLTLSATSVDKKSHSWAVGPRAGLNTNWIFGDGFRIYGNGAADILYTRYTKLRSTQSAAGVDTFIVRQNGYGVMRPHLELELGLGWGSYFDCNNWHIDFAAGYTFQVFYDQNMFRSFHDDVGILHSTSPNGNLYIQGLTVTVRFDF